MASLLITSPGNSAIMDSIRQAKEGSFPWTNKHTCTLLIIFVVKSLQKKKIEQIYYYDPQPAGINMQSPQSESTPRRLTLHGTPQEYFHVKCLPAESHYFLSYIFLTTSNGAFLSSGYFLMGEWRVKVFFSHFLKTFCKKPWEMVCNSKQTSFFSDTIFVHICKSGPLKAS